MRIMLAGPSGIGKTTLANQVSTLLDKQFISGSVSDLLPKTKDIPHSDMLDRDSQELYREDYQILNLRKKVFEGMADFVSDRSFVDLATYFLYKQASKIPACEVEHFINLCGRLTTSLCDLLVVLELSTDDIHTWITEDNGKRIVSNYFQTLITYNMRMVLKLMGYKKCTAYNTIPVGKFLSYRVLDQYFEVGNIKNIYGETKVVIIKDLNLTNRIDIIKHLCRKK